MKLLEFYESIGGDYEGMLSRLSKEESIKKYLRKFCNDAEYNGMVHGYEIEDWDKMFKCSHSLKGVCANLGLTTLQLKVSELCECVRNGNPKTDMSNMMVEVKACYENIVSQIGQIE